MDKNIDRETLLDIYGTLCDYYYHSFRLREALKYESSYYSEAKELLEVSSSFVNTDLKKKLEFNLDHLLVNIASLHEELRYRKVDLLKKIHLVGSILDKSPKEVINEEKNSSGKAYLDGKKEVDILIDELHKAIDKTRHDKGDNE